MKYALKTSVNLFFVPGLKPKSQIYHVYCLMIVKVDAIALDFINHLKI